MAIYTPRMTKNTLWIGYGLMGRALARHASGTDWVRTVGVVDAEPQALVRAAEDLGLSPNQVHRSLGQTFKVSRPNIVIINTPSEQHYRQAAVALRNSAHVLVAKPAVSNLTQALRLYALSQECRRKVAVGQQMRFNRHYRAVGQLVASGELGRISHVHFLNSKPRPDPLNLGKMPHPAMLEMACHHFDALFALLPRARPVAIAAHGYKAAWSRYRSHSTVDACIELTNNVRVLYHAGFDAQAACYELRVEGSKGVLRVRGEHMSSTTFSYELAPPLGRFSPVDLEAQVGGEGAWTILLQQWRAWLAGGKEPSFSLRNNLRVLALLQAGMESIDLGRRVDLQRSRVYQRALAA